MSTPYEFTIGAGMDAPKGKPSWPDNLTLVFDDSYRSLEVIGYLANQLKHQKERGAREITLNFPGKLEELDE